MPPRPLFFVLHLRGAPWPNELHRRLSDKGADSAEHRNTHDWLDRLHPELPHELIQLAWLDLDSDSGQEYWAAMELMGLYAAANAMQKTYESLRENETTLGCEEQLMKFPEFNEVIGVSEKYELAEKYGVES